MPVKKRNTGESSERLFRTIMEKAYGKSVYIEKFPDTKMVKHKDRTAILGAPPADFVVTAASQMFYAEVKSTVDPVSFSISQFTKSQEKAMARQKAAGGSYMVYIHSLAHNQWYAIEGATLLILAKKMGKKSIKWAELEMYAWNL